MFLFFFHLIIINKSTPLKVLNFKTLYLSLDAKGRAYCGKEKDIIEKLNLATVSLEGGQTSGLPQSKNIYICCRVWVFKCFRGAFLFAANETKKKTTFF